jgi:hypothetical protein
MFPWAARISLSGFGFDCKSLGPVGDRGSQYEEAGLVNQLLIKDGKSLIGMGCRDLWLIFCMITRQQSYYELIASQAHEPAA